MHMSQVFPAGFFMESTESNSVVRFNAAVMRGLGQGLRAAARCFSMRRVSSFSPQRYAPNTKLWSDIAQQSMKSAQTAAVQSTHELMRMLYNELLYVVPAGGKVFRFLHGHATEQGAVDLERTARQFSAWLIWSTTQDARATIRALGELGPKDEDADQSLISVAQTILSAVHLLQQRHPGNPQLPSLALQMSTVVIYALHQKGMPVSELQDMQSSRHLSVLAQSIPVLCSVFSWYWLCRQTVRYSDDLFALYWCYWMLSRFTFQKNALKKSIALVSSALVLGSQGLQWYYTRQSVNLGWTLLWSFVWMRHFGPGLWRSASQLSMKSLPDAQKLQHELTSAYAEVERMLEQYYELLCQQDGMCSSLLSGYKNALERYFKEFSTEQRVESLWFAMQTWSFVLLRFGTNPLWHQQQGLYLPSAYSLLSWCSTAVAITLCHTISRRYAIASTAELGSKLALRILPQRQGERLSNVLTVGEQMGVLAPLLVEIAQCKSSPNALQINCDREERKRLSQFLKELFNLGLSEKSVDLIEQHHVQALLKRAEDRVEKVLYNSLFLSTDSSVQYAFAELRQLIDVVVRKPTCIRKKWWWSRFKNEVLCSAIFIPTNNPFDEMRASVEVRQLIHALVREPGCIEWWLQLAQGEGCTLPQIHRGVKAIIENVDVQDILQRVRQQLILRQEEAREFELICAVYLVMLLRPHLPRNMQEKAFFSEYFLGGVVHTALLLRVGVLALSMQSMPEELGALLDLGILLHTDAQLRTLPYTSFKNVVGLLSGAVRRLRAHTEAYKNYAEVLGSWLQEPQQGVTQVEIQRSSELLCRTLSKLFLRVVMNKCNSNQGAAYWAGKASRVLGQGTPILEMGLWSLHPLLHHVVVALDGLLDVHKRFIWEVVVGRRSFGDNLQKNAALLKDLAESGCFHKVCEALCKVRLIEQGAMHSGVLASLKQKKNQCLQRGNLWQYGLMHAQDCYQNRWVYRACVWHMERLLVYLSAVVEGAVKLSSNWRQMSIRETLIGCFKVQGYAIRASIKSMQVAAVTGLGVTMMIVDFTATLVAFWRRGYKKRVRRVMVIGSEVLYSLVKKVSGWYAYRCRLPQISCFSKATNRRLSACGGWLWATISLGVLFHSSAFAALMLLVGPRVVRVSVGGLDSFCKAIAAWWRRGSASPSVMKTKVDFKKGEASEECATGRQVLGALHGSQEMSPAGYERILAQLNLSLDSPEISQVDQEFAPGQTGQQGEYCSTQTAVEEGTETMVTGDPPQDLEPTNDGSAQMLPDAVIERRMFPSSSSDCDRNGACVEVSHGIRRGDEYDREAVRHTDVLFENPVRFGGR